MINNNMKVIVTALWTADDSGSVIHRNINYINGEDAISDANPHTTPMGDRLIYNRLPFSTKYYSSEAESPRESNLGPTDWWEATDRMYSATQTGRRYSLDIIRLTKTSLARWRR